MTKFQNRLYQVVLFAGDLLFFILSTYLAYALRNNDFAPNIDAVTTLVVAFSPVFVIIAISYFIGALYEVPSILTSIRRTKLLVNLHILALLSGFAIFYIFPIFAAYGLAPKVLLVIMLALYTVFQVLWRVYASYHIKTKKKKKVLLIGQGQMFTELKEAVNSNPQSPICFVEHIEVNSPLLAHGAIESLRAVLKENDITLLVLDVKNEKTAALLPYFYNLVGDGVRIYDAHKMYEDVFRRTSLSSVGYFWFFENVDLEKRVYSFVKRIIDLLLVVPVFIVFVISLPVVYVLQKIENEGTGLFSIQKRWGKNGKTINVYKYRTMLYTDEGKWRIEKGNQNRPTRLGKFLNKTNIDELPQVINIIKGEMSFIGPRNDIVALGERLSKEIPFYMIRYSVQPGISGWAQTLQVVEGQNPQTIEQNITRLQYDLFYIKNRSVLLDVVIILRTIKTLITRLAAHF